MSHTDMSRRGLLKTSFLGAAAAGATGFGLSSQAQAKQAANAQTYDAVVLGAGPAGLIAAITAHDAGAKVVVLEKRDRPRRQRHLRPRLHLRLGHAPPGRTGHQGHG